MRVAVGQLWQETNTFNPLPTRRADFEAFGVLRGAEVIDRLADTNEPGGFIQSLRQWPERPELVGLVRLPAWPAGRATAETLTWLHADLAESYRYVDPARSAMHLDAAEGLAQESADPLLALAIRWLRARLRGFLGQNVFADLQQCVAALDMLSAEERARLAGMGRLNLPSRGLLAQWLAFIGGYREATAFAEAEVRKALKAA